MGQQIRRILVAISFVSTIVAPCSSLPSVQKSGGKHWKRALESPYGEELKRCRDDWANISQNEDPEIISSCMSSLLFAVAPRMAQPGGIPEFGIQQLDPLVVPGVISMGGDIFNANFTGLTLIGTSKAWTENLGKVKYDPRAKEATIVLESPHEIAVKSNYRMEFNPGALFGHGETRGKVTSGHFDGSAKDLRALVSIGMRKAKNGELQVKSSKGNFELGSMKATFKSDDPNDTLPQLINSMMSSKEVHEQVMGELKPQINGIFAKTMGSLFHRGWKILDKL